MSKDKILTINRCKEKIQSLQEQGQRVVFTNGCFDVLHVGHLTLLEKSKTFGDILCVGINTDHSVRQLKGPNRPVNNETDRARLLAALSVVDCVTLFDDQTPCDIVATLKPDVHVKGGDYDPEDFENMPEAKVVKKYGGEVKIIPIVKGKSSTNIINNLKQ